MGWVTFFRFFLGGKVGCGQCGGGVFGGVCLCDGVRGLEGFGRGFVCVCMMGWARDRGCLCVMVLLLGVVFRYGGAAFWCCG
jgi:hypothetical protein